MFVALTNSEMKQVLAAGYRLLTDHKLHVPLMFWGPSGVGKTAAVHQAAADLSQTLGKKVRAVIVKPGQADSPGDIIGMPEKVSYFPCPWCLQAGEQSDEYTRLALEAHAHREHAIQTWAETEAALTAYGDQIHVKQRFAITDIWPTHGPALLCLDELNRAGPDIRNALFGLVNERTLEMCGLVLPDDVAVSATLNPNTAEYGDTHELDGAMVKRGVHFSVLPTPEEWLEFMAGQPEAQTEAGAKALSFFREHLEFITPTDDQNPVLENIRAANRTCTALVRLSLVLKGKLLAEAAAGTLGATAANAFMQHMSKQEAFLKARDLLADYPRHQAETQQAIAAGRQDMLLQTQEDLVRHLVRRQKPLSPSDVSNFVLYLKDLLADNVWSLLSTLMTADTKAGKDEDAPIKRHVSAIFNNPAVNELMAEHNKRVRLVAPSP